MASIVTGLLLVAGCAHSDAHGSVEGQFRLPGRPVTDLQRGGLSFAAPGSEHGPGLGHTARVGADGRYSITLSPGSYSVVGALAGQPGRLAPEGCAGTIKVVVKANATTHADFVCHPVPATPPAP